MNATDNPHQDATPAARPVTPEELRSMTFARAPLTRRGLAEDEVREALRRAAEALHLQVDENNRLRAALQRQRDWLRANNLEGTPQQTGVPGVDAVLQQARAQQVADQTIAHAREQAKSLLRTARTQANAMLQQSREQAAQLGGHAPALEQALQFAATVHRTAAALALEAEALAGQLPDRRREHGALDSGLPSSDVLGAVQSA